MTPSLAELPEWFKVTAEGVKLVKEAERTAKAERLRVAEELAAVDAEEALALPPLAKAMDAGWVREAKARDSWTDQRVAAVKATQAHESAARKFYQRKEDLRRRLRDTAPECVRQLSADLTAAFDDVRMGRKSLPQASVGRLLEMGRHVRETVSLLQETEAERAVAEIRDELAGLFQ